MHSQEPPYYSNTLFSRLANEETEEMIQLVVSEEEGQETKPTAADTLPLLPFKQLVLFPGLIIPLTLRHQKFIQLAKKVHEEDGFLGVVTQKNTHVEEPRAKDIFRVGTMAKVLKVIVFPDGTTSIILQGKQRFKINAILAETPHLLAQVEPLKNKPLNTKTKEAKALLHSLKEVASNILSLSPEVPSEVQVVLNNIKDPDFLTYFLSANIHVDIAKKQELLEINSSNKRATLLLQYLLKDLEFTQLKKDIQSKVRTDIEQQATRLLPQGTRLRCYKKSWVTLNQKNWKNCGARGKKKQWPEEIDIFFNKTLDKAERLSPHNPDYATLINHAELLVELPWGYLHRRQFKLRASNTTLKKRSFWVRQGQGTDIRIPRCIATETRYERPYLVFIRSSRRRKNLFVQIHCPSAQQKICTHITRRPQR